MGRRDGPKTGGRKKGTPNKATTKLAEKLELLELDLPNCIKLCLNELDTIMDDASHLMTPSEKVSVTKAKVSVYLELMQYVYPKRKSIDYTDGSDEVHIYKVKWADEEDADGTEDTLHEASDTPPKTH